VRIWKNPARLEVCCLTERSFYPKSGKGVNNFFHFYFHRFCAEFAPEEKQICGPAA
jgi:hypothetical protein